jgi:hypothetical protein
MIKFFITAPLFLRFFYSKSMPLFEVQRTVTEKFTSSSQGRNLYPFASNAAVVILYGAPRCAIIANGKQVHASVIMDFKRG